MSLIAKHVAYTIFVKLARTLKRDCPGPPGFGLDVSRKKTYILRRKVLGKSMLSIVENFTDFDTIQDARAKAKDKTSDELKQLLP